MKMKQKLFLSIGIFCCLVFVLIASSAFTMKNEIEISSDTPFPQTGSITVYKYKQFQKVQIGELQWSAITEQKSYNERTWSEVTLRVHNTTDQYIETFFTYKGNNGYIDVKVRPEDNFETTQMCNASVTGVVPATKELTLR
jgi:hypothetical protein